MTLNFKSVSYPSCNTVDNGIASINQIDFFVRFAIFLVIQECRRIISGLFTLVNILSCYLAQW